MEERKAKGKTVKGSGGEDLISKLPDALISQILLYLPTKEAVRTSVLSSRWKSLWLLIPEFDLDSSEFPDYNAFVSFVDRLIGFCREKNSCLHKLKLGISKYENEQSCVTRWLDFVTTRKLTHLAVEFWDVKRECLEVMPLSLYVCETLVHLSLDSVLMGSFKSVSLPRLKTMSLQENEYANEASLELLISSCPLLEDLSIVRRADDNVKVLRVHSQALTRLSVDVVFGDVYETYYTSKTMVLIDAPRLEYLNFNNEISQGKVISSSGSLTRVNLSDDFCLWDDLVKRRSFFDSISGVKEMEISSKTFEIIYDILPLPQFGNLSFLDAQLDVSCLESLPAFLESFPNLRSLYLGIFQDPRYSSGTAETRSWLVPQCLLSSLKVVEIRGLSRGELIVGVARYFAENSLLLKELVVHFDGSMRKQDPISRELLALPRRSGRCQIIVC